MGSRNTSNSLGLRWTRSPRTSTILCSRSTLNCGLANFGSGSSELDSSGRAVFYLLPNSRLAPQQFYRETERAGSRVALYCPQYRADAAAYRLQGVSQHKFPAETDVAATDSANDQATLQNIRLWA